ncbi:MAG TPA: alpha/beta hydrolase [Polyangiaceae bacterium]|nr:alpha/beta hydrolase [Polyangiaceae bacterium]
MGLSLYERARQLEIVVGGARFLLTASHSKRSTTGRRLLLLHGNPGNLDDFVALFPKLDFAAEVLAIDLPGFGRSAPAPGNSRSLTLSDLASVAFAAADACGWPTFEIIGHSHGGGVAQAMAWNAHPRVERITLLGTLGTPAHTSYKQLALPGAGSAMQLVGKCLSLPGSKTWFRVIQRNIAKQAFHPEPVPPEHLERGVEAILAAPTILRSMVRVALGKPCQALAESVASITSAVTFVHGELDALVPSRHARNLHELRLQAGRASAFVLVPNAGHMLPLTHPELVAEHARGVDDGH